MFVEFRFKGKGMQPFTPARSSQFMKYSSLDDQSTDKQPSFPHLKNDWRGSSSLAISQVSVTSQRCNYPDLPNSGPMFFPPHFAAPI